MSPKSDDPAGCWLWTAYRDDKGYGRITHRTDGVMVLHIVPRLSWELHNGPIPDGLWVLHNCPGGDDPACCRPSHLFLGTALDNQLDCAAKGRKPVGEQCIGAKLTEERVIEVRRRLAEGVETHDALAIEFGVARQTISDIVNGRKWKHVP
jgi:hypothetical protein